MVLAKVLLVFYLVKQEKLKILSMKKRLKKEKIMKWPRVYKGYAGTYNGEISNPFNPELQPKDTESAIRNKLKDFYD